jgi:hypothetical protein
VKFALVATALVLAGCNLGLSPDETASTSSSGSGITLFDGTYSYSYQIDINNVEQSYNNSAQFIVTNGVITSNPAGFSGSVTDSAGAVSFTGACPISGNTGGATFTGTLDDASPMFGQGTWTCSTGGVSDNWQVSDGVANANSGGRVTLRKTATR